MKMAVVNLYDILFNYKKNDIIKTSKIEKKDEFCGWMQLTNEDKAGAKFGEDCHTRPQAA